MSRGSGYRTVSTGGECVWSDVAGSDAPILTDDQVAAGIGSPVHFAGKSPSVPNPEGPPVVGCEWTESTDPAVSVAVDEQDFPSPPDAAAQYQSQLSQALTMVDANLKIDGYQAFLAEFNGGAGLYILIGDRIVSVDVGRYQSAKDWQRPLTAIGSDLVARLQPQRCSPVSGGPGAALRQQLADPPDWNSQSATAVLNSVPGDPSEAAGFFNALDQPQVQSMVAQVFPFTAANQPEHPAIWDLLKADLESCLLSETFTHSLVATPNADHILNAMYSDLAGDPRASRGLMEPMTASDILAGVEADPGVLVPDPSGDQVLDDEFGHVAAAVLQYMVSDQLAMAEEESMLNLATGEKFFRYALCPATASCFMTDAVSAAKAHLDGDTTASGYADDQVVKDALEEADADLLPPLGVVFDLVDLFDLGPDPGQVAAAQKAAGKFLCGREWSAENQLVDKLDSDHRLLYQGKPLRGAIAAPSDVYGVQGGRPEVTFADASGADSGSAVFAMINEVQDTWRIMTNGEIPPSDYEACGLGGQDPHTGPVRARAQRQRLRAGQPGDHQRAFGADISGRSTG